MRKKSTTGLSKLSVVVIALVAAMAVGAVYYLSMPSGDLPASITAGGASFPYPIMTKWISEYNKLHPNVQITYQSVGSGAGLNGLFAKTFAFAGSDAPLTDSQMTANPGVITIPESGGGIVIAYNISGIGSGLNLTADVIAWIFQGNITKWNDPAIIAINPGKALPDADIVTVHRQDSSGTTFGFTDYLTHATQQWKLGAGKTVNWPTGLGANGNSGVASVIQNTPNSVGYLEFFYAHNNSIPYANVQNKNGYFITPSLTSISLALKAAAPVIANDIRASVVNMPGNDVYPISVFTYIMVYKDMSYLDQATAQGVARFLWWVVHDGQNYSEALLYPKMPTEVVTIAENALKQLQYNGKPLL